MQAQTNPATAANCDMVKALVPPTQNQSLSAILTQIVFYVKGKVQENVAPARKPCINKYFLFSRFFLD